MYVSNSNCVHSSQISDWLSLQQNTLKNYYVDVGDVDAIVEAIDKQKVINARRI